jgi:hypothetical protein
MNTTTISAARIVAAACLLAALVLAVLLLTGDAGSISDHARSSWSSVVAGVKWP